VLIVIALYSANFVVAWRSARGHDRWQPSLDAKGLGVLRVRLAPCSFSLPAPPCIAVLEY
jgi:pyrimidine deaminase RibD-like protein